jgi:hypothetical protein
MALLGVGPDHENMPITSKQVLYFQFWWLKKKVEGLRRTENGPRCYGYSQ